MPKYILEGEWSGYTSAQCRVCHREVIDARRAKRFIGEGSLRTIQFTDGTLLRLSVREALRREKVDVRNQYGSLIREASARSGSFVRVADLSDEEAA